LKNTTLTDVFLNSEKPQQDNTMRQTLTRISASAQGHWHTSCQRDISTVPYH